MFRRPVGWIVFSSRNWIQTYRVENGRGQAGSSHQLKAQSATALLRSQHFLGAASVDQSFHAPQFRRWGTWKNQLPMSEYAAAQLLDLTDTLQSHSLTRVHRTSPRRGIHTVWQLTRIVAVNFRLSVTPLMSTDPRPGHVLKTASA